jgi:transketolase
VVLDADVGTSIRSINFGKQYPDRYFNVGIAEFNMATIAAGLAANGFIPFANTFATFMATRCADTINNMINHDNLNVKLCGAYAGISDSFDGASHHALFDIAFLRALPNMTILVPCDANQTRKAVLAAADFQGPVYLRLSRAAAPLITKDDTPFTIGKGLMLREGTDINIVATGTVTSNALAVAGILAVRGISARVINLHTVKPVDCELLLKSREVSKHFVTVEEHSTHGGLGSAVAETLAKTDARITMIGIDGMTQSGGYDELQAIYGLDAASIAKTAAEALHTQQEH